MLVMGDRHIFFFKKAYEVVVVVVVFVLSNDNNWDGEPSSYILLTPPNGRREISPL